MRVLQTASDISQLEMTSYALQQILQHFTAKRMKQTSTVMLVSRAVGGVVFDARHDRAAEIQRCAWARHSWRSRRHAVTICMCQKTWTSPLNSGLSAHFASSLQGTCSVLEAQRAAAVKAAREAGDSQGQDPAAAGGLYSLLDARNQSNVAPFLTTRFTQIATKSEGTGELLVQLLQPMRCSRPDQVCDADWLRAS